MSKQINAVEAAIILPCLRAMYLQKKEQFNLSKEVMLRTFEDPVNLILGRYSLSAEDVYTAFRPSGAEVGMGDIVISEARQKLKEIGIQADANNFPDVPISRKFTVNLLQILDQ